MNRQDERPLRYRCDLEAHLAWAQGVHTVRILDLSETGAFVETGLDLQVGDAGVLTLALPGGDPWHADIQVVRLSTAQRELHHPRLHHLTVARPGAGVAFAHVPEDEVERLRGFLELLDER